MFGGKHGLNYEVVGRELLPGQVPLQLRGSHRIEAMEFAAAGCREVDSRVL